jgi:DNA-binding NtrC family response regulator
MEKILCVDDDFSLLRLYQAELSEEGYQVILAKDGKEALWQFEKEKPQVVVLDIRLPTMDGIETLNALLGKDRQAQVILNTAHSQYKENFMTWGAAAYVLKSSDLERAQTENSGTPAKWQKPPKTMIDQETRHGNRFPF